MALSPKREILIQSLSDCIQEAAYGLAQYSFSDIASKIEQADSDETADLIYHEFVAKNIFQKLLPFLQMLNEQYEEHKSTPEGQLFEKLINGENVTLISLNPEDDEDNGEGNVH